jgi:hypothetical protein
MNASEGDAGGPSRSPNEISQDNQKGQPLHPPTPSAEARSIPSEAAGEPNTASVLISPAAPLACQDRLFPDGVH